MEVWMARGCFHPLPIAPAQSQVLYQSRNVSWYSHKNFFFARKTVGKHSSDQTYIFSLPHSFTYIKAVTTTTPY